MSQCRMPERGISDLSAKALTEDAEGCSRLRAVIATDPGYAVRAQEAVADRDAEIANPFTHASLDAGTACPSVNPAPAAPVRRMSVVPEIPAPGAASAVLALVIGAQSLSSLTIQVPTP